MNLSCPKGVCACGKITQTAIPPQGNLSLGSGYETLSQKVLMLNAQLPDDVLWGSEFIL